ncbi:MAG TPA: substrate-binding domain-containing protein [Vicinamibacterales bacterium]|nr:substrate-binding domain-containing protein [Vicinamibacterales bacterium]
MDARSSAVMLGLLLLLAQPIGSAAELQVWTARVGATVLAEIGPEFERATGHKLAITADLPDPFLKRVRAGEPFDLLISTAGPIDALVREGELIEDTRATFAKSGIGVEVRKGARKPDISSVEAFKRAVLDAKSIAYLQIGSGLYLQGLFERMGIAASIKPKVTRPEADIVSELVAKGEIELGMVVSTQILTTPGVDFVGPLPPEIQHYIVFVGAVSTDSKAPDAARELLRFLASPRALAVIKAQGMEPGD